VRVEDDLLREELEIPVRKRTMNKTTARLKGHLHEPRRDMVDGPATGGQRHSGVGSFVPCRGHLDNERTVTRRYNPREKEGTLSIAARLIAKRHVLEEDPRYDEGAAVRFRVASGQPCVQWGISGGGGDKPLPWQNSP
jgi:hypothetical protein